MRLEWLSAETVEEVVMLAREMHQESRLAALPLDVERVRSALRAAVEDDRGVQFAVLCRAASGEAAGFMLGVVVQPWFSGALLAHDRGLFVQRRYRGTRAAVLLLRAFVRWAQKRDVSEVHMYQSVGVETERFSRLMGGLGFEYRGGNFALSLDHES